MSKEFGKILVVQQKMIGDVLTSTILLEALREKYPKAELHYLVNSHTVPVLENNPFIDKLVLFTPEVEKSKLEFFRFLKKIRKEKYDVVIDVYGKISSNLITLFSGAQIRIGEQKSHTKWIYSQIVKNSKQSSGQHNLAVENRLGLLKPLDIEINHDVQPKIYLSEKEISEGKKIMLANDINFDNTVLMISLLGSSKEKTYPLAYMAKLLDTIVDRNNNVHLIFNYFPSQIEEASGIYDLCHEKTRNRIWFDLYATDLRKFLSFVFHCDAVIGNEGGAINMAKALNIPTFAVFSPWVRKEIWGNKNNPNHIGVHLRDYKPEFFQNYNRKKFKANQKQLYAEFKPSLFQEALAKFIETLNDKNQNLSK
ncbi:MAG TPA: glycosyltransferase family 9 protein [Flavobacteriaceae bacterium]|nr:glycosyltransferase family 9 protein [Flavobacteriaceae bacterium]